MRYFIFLCLPFTFMVSKNIYAFECEVDYIAKKTKTNPRWFGTIKDTKVKTGTEEGKGDTKSKCRDNALSPLIQEGWEITSDKIRIKD